MNNRVRNAVPHKAHCSAVQTKPQCVRLLGKRGLRVSVTEKSKQSQVQSECREGWKGVRKRKTKTRQGSKRQDGEKRRLQANKQTITKYYETWLGFIGVNNRITTTVCLVKMSHRLS